MREYAGLIAANAPLTIRAAKAAVSAYEKYTDVAAAGEVSALVDACFNSDDYKEGRRAFAEKRKPLFQGK